MVNLSNGIGYSGYVNASLSDSEKIPIYLKNAGCKPLWDALAMAITGYDITNKKPHYLMVGKKRPGDLDIQPCLYRKIPFQGKVYGDVVSNDPNSTTARFTATVTRNDRIQKINNNYGDIAYLIMYSLEGKVLATVKDNEQNTIATVHNSLITGVDAVYEWNLVFKNLIDNQTSD